MNPGESGTTTSTIMKLFLLVTACIIINIFLYLFEDKWIGGVFSGAWLLAIVLTYGYNYLFNLNITNYSITTLLQKYFLPILTYLAWIGVIYWLITAQNDLSENPNNSQLSRNFAGVMTGFIPVLAGIVTFHLKKYADVVGVGWSILISIVLLFLGSYGYYLNTLREGCDKNISKNICWTYSWNVTFLCFILITAFFIFVSTIDLVGFMKIFQLLPRILTTNPMSPLSIFSIITYLILWISLIIHDSNYGDEEGAPAIFTAIAIIMFIFLLIKEMPLGTKIINMITYIYNQPLSSKFLHVSIITTFIVSIYFTSTYLESKPNNSDINSIWALDIILSILFLGYLVLIGRGYYLS